MPDDSNGIYNVPNGTLVNSGDTVLPSQHNPWATDSSAAISNRFSKDGRAPATGNWNLNTFRITNIGAPVANGDAATKQYADNANPNNIYTLVAVNTTVDVADKGRWYRTATAGIVFSPASAATLGANHFFRVKNDSTGIVTIDPTGSETINGALTVALNPGSEAYVICDGANFWASIVSQQASGPDYVQGLTLSNNAVDAANDIDIAVGSAKSGSRVVSLSSVMTKRLDASWAAGSGNGGLDTGSKANSTTYHVHSIVNASTGVSDAIFSLSATAPTVPSGWSLVQRLGAVITNSSGNILAFSQDGKSFLLSVMVNDISDTTLNTTAKLYALTVPSGVKVEALVRFATFDTGFCTALITSLDESDQASGAAGPNSISNATANGRGSATLQVRTNTSRQIRAVAQGVSLPIDDFQGRTYGWIDTSLQRI